MKSSLSFFSICNILRKMPESYYAVAKGRCPGIYKTWDECNAQVFKYPGPKFKKFSSQSAAEDFIKEHSTSSALTNNNNQASSSNTTQKRPLPKTLFTLGRKQTKVTPEKEQFRISKRNFSTTFEDDIPKQVAKQRKTSHLITNTCRDKKTSEGFVITEDGYTNVYTDGACSSNGGKNAKAGIGVWFGDHHPLNVSQPVVGRATNNMAEIQAVTVAAMQAKKGGIKKLKINTDSKFLISCITKWMPAWKAKGWRTALNKPVINKTELIEMEKALASLEISWNHVNGHVGIYGNEEADKLARAGCSQYKNTT